MPLKSVSVVDIGTSKISVVIGSKGVNNTFIIQGSGESEYAGYYEGEFLEENKLKEVFSSAIAEAESSAGQPISKLYIGVPADFSTCITKTLSQNFGGRVKITNDNILALYKRANELSGNENYILLNCSPICFTLDDGRKTVNPIGQKTTKITACVSLIYVEKSFVSKMNNLLKLIGVTEVEYLSSSLCEAMYLLPQQRREEDVLLIDCGYLATSVAIVKGEGLVDLKSFAVGGAHISADISECLSIPFNEAEQLRKQLILSVIPSPKDDYEIVRKENVIPVSMQKTNEIVNARLEMICLLIQKCVKQNDSQDWTKMPYYLTGGGISYIKGCKEYLSKCLGVNVSLLTPPDIHMQKPHYSTVLGLLNTAIKQDSKKKGIWGFVLNIFK